MVWSDWCPSHSETLRISPVALRMFRAQAWRLSRARDRRHSAATHWHERGGSIDVIQDAFGHRNADATRDYTRATGKMFEALDHSVSGFRLLNAS